MNPTDCDNNCVCKLVALGYDVATASMIVAVANNMPELAGVIGASLTRAVAR